MSVDITYFVHGTTTDNERGFMTGWLPGELSERGLRQAEELGDAVRSRTFDAVYCSDLKRAADTARIAFGDRYEIHPDARLRECHYGDRNGGSERGVVKTDHIDTAYPNGERYRDVEQRMREFLAEIARTMDGTHIAVVAHQAPQLALEVILNGKTWEEAFAADWRNTGAWQPGWEYRAD